MSEPSNLVAHAKYELELINEEPKIYSTLHYNPNKKDV